MKVLSSLLTFVLMVRMTYSNTYCIKIETGTTVYNDGYMAYQFLDEVESTVGYYTLGGFVVERCFENPTSVAAWNVNDNAWAGSIVGTLNGEIVDLVCTNCAGATFETAVVLDGNSDSTDQASTHCLDGQACAFGFAQIDLYCISIETGSSAYNDGYLTYRFENQAQSTTGHYTIGGFVAQRCFGSPTSVMAWNTNDDAWVGTIIGNYNGERVDLVCEGCTGQNFDTTVVIDGNSDLTDLASTHCINSQICEFGFPTEPPTVMPTEYPSKSPVITDNYGEECWSSYSCKDNDRDDVCEGCGLHNSQEQYCCRSSWNYDVTDKCFGAIYTDTSLEYHQCVVVEEIELPSRSPTHFPSLNPSLSPSSTPTFIPSTTPTWMPTEYPSKAPVSEPSSSPSVSPSLTPSKTPTLLPTSEPTTIPSGKPSRIPTSVPTGAPSLTPTFVPSRMPTENPSKAPVHSAPSAGPSMSPSFMPSQIPTSAPSEGPSSTPTAVPSALPTGDPSKSPLHSAPSTNPSMSPSIIPTSVPSTIPTTLPTGDPSKAPVISTSSMIPTYIPTETPSTSPTAFPTILPSETPTRLPPNEPSRAPLVAPSSTPSAMPTEYPSRAPMTPVPSTKPVAAPLSAPSAMPTEYPSSAPVTSAPTTMPSLIPTFVPTNVPSRSPLAPTAAPSEVSTTSGQTKEPSQAPGASPTAFPSTESSSEAMVLFPSLSPTAFPSAFHEEYVEANRLTFGSEMGLSVIFGSLSCVLVSLFMVWRCKYRNNPVIPDVEVGKLSRWPSRSAGGDFIPIETPTDFALTETRF